MRLANILLFIIRLYIDVKLGSLTKVPKIAVKDNDDPAQLARDFCRIYALKGDTEKLLTDVIIASMRQNNIPVYGEEAHVTAGKDAAVNRDGRASSTDNREAAPFRPPAPPPPPNRPSDQQHIHVVPRPPEPPRPRYTALGEQPNALNRGRLPPGELNSALNAIFMEDVTDSSSEV